MSGLMLLGVAVGSMHLVLPPSAPTAASVADVR